MNAGDEDKLATKPAGVSKAEWMAARSNERADAAVFDGLMTDNDRLRRRAGATQYGDMSNEALRLKIFNDQNGLLTLAPERVRLVCSEGWKPPLPRRSKTRLAKAFRCPATRWLAG